MKEANNFMSVQVREKAINYNEGSYYRANPYAQQGYIPTASLKNRKQPEFATEIPQGIEFFPPTHRKLFGNIGHQSTLGEVLATPERFPLENSLGSEAGYHRSLQTIDIEGANPNSKKSMGVKNRIKAQEQMLRRNDPILTPILVGAVSEEEQRRQLAQQQLQRRNSRGSGSGSSELRAERKYHSEKKLPPPQPFSRNPYLQTQEQGMQFSPPPELPLEDPEEKDSASELKASRKREVEELKSLYEKEESILKLLESHSLRREVADSAEAASSSSREALKSGSSIAVEKMSPEIRQIFDKERRHIEEELIRKEYRNQVRQLNPTNLSYAGTIVRNSSIFANLGRNMANG